MLCFLYIPPVIRIRKISLSRLGETPIVLRFSTRMMGLTGFLSTRLVSLLWLWPMNQTNWVTQRKRWLIFYNRFLSCGYEICLGARTITPNCWSLWVIYFSHVSFVIFIYLLLTEFPSSFSFATRMTHISADERKTMMVNAKALYGETLAMHKSDSIGYQIQAPKKR